MFHIVQPCANGPRRFEYATIIASHLTVDDAFDELERVRAILGTHGLTALASELTIVTADRSPIRACVQTIEATPTPAATSERHSNRNGRRKHSRGMDSVSQIGISPIDGWDFVEPVLVERVALLPRPDGRVEVWRVEPDGAFSRMSAVEEDLGQLQRFEIATAPLAMPEPPALRPDPPSVAKSRAQEHSWWSDPHVRIRWPKAVGPVVTVAGIRALRRRGDRGAAT
jgi:hypothetical protein